MDVYKVNEELNRHLEDVARFTAQVVLADTPDLGYLLTSSDRRIHLTIWYT